ncbi:MAG: DUF3782 domain-containing protein [Treponema sp.]|jgi:hypothetical protein|nr:DUF3782 domain-containing protein [Treponema sp.]
MGDVTHTREPQRGLTFDDVWAAMMETDRRFKETDRQFKETDRQFKETDRQFKETDKKFKELDKKMGELGNRFGELAEHLVAPSIHKKFNALGYHFDAVSPGGTEIKDPGGRVYAEIDILLQNTDYIVAVEVKSKLLEKDVDAHVKRLEILRRWADKHHDARKIRGAAAGAIVSRAVRQYALKAGLYVIVQTGDTVKIDVPKGFVPRDW